MQVTITVPDELAAKLTAAAPGDTCAIELKVDSNADGVMSGTAVDVLEVEGAGPEAAEPGEEGPPAGYGKSMPPMVQDEMA